MFYINHIGWTIKFVEPNNPVLYRSDGSLSVATCDSSSNVIYINDSLRGAFLRKVLCHEITHAAMFSYDIHLSSEQEELLADLVATYGDEIIDITNKIFKKLRGE